MNLHEQYLALLRRGMPELCELEWRENGMYGPWTMGLWADDAESDIVRDLITMHALRWIEDGDIDLSPNVRWFAGRGWCLDTANGVGFRAHTDALNAILAATAHLEPKKTLA